MPVDGRWSPGDPIEALRELQRVDPENPNELLKSCDTEMGVAFTPVRIAELAYAFGDDGVLASCCERDWSEAMQRIASAIQRHLGRACVDLPVGAEAAADCRLFETLADGTEREVPHADAAPGGWSLVRDVEACPGGQLRLDGAPLAGAAFRFECAAAAADEGG